ncbi:uncharacterized protein N0V89_002034 [Didymosphaeria variabile]|uniref:Uncharacterized protein n=1 Tax=Didymosphaeria variabile TaxID=1932322 RepID=A0A9W9CE57_9PLEO|nr:uncharacterized protein N0V89_002034 [Didymosphaeria variabile]KAJ4357459.1 hypothetical protein N0V89_002034 [Didymosphaeria variabile]
MSSTAPYLLHLTSRPNQVSPQTWKEWYDSLPDLVTSHASVRATFYEEIDLPGTLPSASYRSFLAVYQSDVEQPLETKNSTHLQTTSVFFENNAAKSNASGENADLDARNYALVQVYNPQGVGEAPPPEILTAEAQPADPDDYDNWFRTEHIGQLAALPGYRRTLRYKLGPKTAWTKGEDVPLFLAIHEVEDARLWMEGRAEAAKTATPSEWAVRNVKGSSEIPAAVVRKTAMRIFIGDFDFKWGAVARWLEDDSSARFKQLSKFQNKLENQMFGNIELVHRVFDVAACWDQDHTPSLLKDSTRFQRDVIWSEAFNERIFVTIIWPLRDAVKLNEIIDCDVWKEMYGAMWVAFAEAVFTNATWSQQANSYPAIDMKPVFQAVRQVPEKYFADRPEFDQIPSHNLEYTCEENLEGWMQAREKAKEKVAEELGMRERKTTGRFY